MSSWTVIGCRYRGALWELMMLCTDGRRVFRDGDSICIDPATGLPDAELLLIRDLKAEVLAILDRYPQDVWGELEADPNWDAWLGLENDAQT